MIPDSGDSQKEKDCCKDRNTYLKIQNEQLTSTSEYTPKNNFLSITGRTDHEVISFLNDHNTLEIYCDTSPPFEEPAPVYLQNKVFRI